MFQTHQRSENNEDEVIEMIKKSLSVARVAAFCLPLALLASCGSSWPEGVQGTEININPAAIGQSTTTTTGASLVLELFTIELRSPTGYPQISTQLTIDTPGTLYIVGINPGGSPTYTPVTATYTTITNDNGVVTVAVDFSVPPRTEGDITVISARSGTAYNRTNVTYTCTPTPPATAC
jgi:hypothetical protein